MLTGFCSLLACALTTVGRPTLSGRHDGEFTSFGLASAGPLRYATRRIGFPIRLSSTCRKYGNERLDSLYVGWKSRPAGVHHSLGRWG